MNSMVLIWTDLARRKGRTFFAFLSIVMAFALFSVLAAVRYGMLGQLTIRTAERLDTRAEVSQGTPLPLSYYDKIVTVSGVTAVAYLKGFQVYFQEKQNTFTAVFTNARELFKVYQEFSTPPAEMQAMLADRQGAVAGTLLAKRMGWKVGDTIPVQGGPMQKDGGTTWYFHLRGIYNTDLPTAYQSFLVTHYQYYNQGVTPQHQNLVDQYKERVDDPRNDAQISSAIDKLFENSTPQTFTQSEEILAISQIREFGDISAMVSYVGLAVFFSMLLIVGNTLAQTIRERTTEFAMFRALGFGPGRLNLMVLWEALLLMVSGAAIGLLTGWVIIGLVYPRVGNLLPTFGITWNAAVAGIMLSAVFAVLVSLVPMQRIVGMHVAEALRKT